jgi:hypothetical protein
MADAITGFGFLLACLVCTPGRLLSGLRGECRTRPAWWCHEARLAALSVFLNPGKPMALSRPHRRRALAHASLPIRSVPPADSLALVLLVPLPSLRLAG